LKTISLPKAEAFPELSTARILITFGPVPTQYVIVSPVPIAA
jgi:hypothetical protein